MRRNDRTIEAKLLFVFSSSFLLVGERKLFVSFSFGGTLHVDERHRHSDEQRRPSDVFVQHSHVDRRSKKNNETRFLRSTDRVKRKENEKFHIEPNPLILVRRCATTSFVTPTNRTSNDRKIRFNKNRFFRETSPNRRKTISRTVKKSDKSNGSRTRYELVRFVFQPFGTNVCRTKNSKRHNDFSRLKTCSVRNNSN